MAVRYEIAVGLNKGHKTAKVKRVRYTGDKKAKGLRASNLKNVSSSDTLHQKLITPLERRRAVLCKQTRHAFGFTRDPSSPPTCHNDDNQFIHSQTNKRSAQPLRNVVNILLATDRLVLLCLYTG